MSATFLHRLLCMAILLLGWPLTSSGQAVSVTMSLDASNIGLGQTTTLRVYAQVLPAFRPTADRIFSWYLDVLNTNGAAVNANYGAMQKTASDRDPQTASTGVTQGATRHGIYDTFLFLHGAGVTNRVELMSIPVSGTAVGQTRFLVQAGTGVTNLSGDFLVALTNGGAPLAGGNYTAGFVDLTVWATAPPTIRLTNSHVRLGGITNKVTLTFNPVAGHNHFVEFRDQIVGGPGWQVFAGGPHNSGFYLNTNTVPLRFYRIRAVPSP